MKITLTVDSKHSVELDYQAVVSCLDDLGDEPSLSNLFGALVNHPSSNVRYILAQKECLPISALAVLANDPHIEVVREVSQNKTALKAFSADQFIRMIERDFCIALELAERLSLIEDNATRGSVILEMQKSGDPELLAKISKICRKLAGGASCM